MCFIVFAIFGCVIIVSNHTLAYRADCCLPGAVDEKLFCDIGYFVYLSLTLGDHSRNLIVAES